MNRCNWSRNPYFWRSSGGDGAGDSGGGDGGGDGGGGDGGGGDGGNGGGEKERESMQMRPFQ